MRKITTTITDNQYGAPDKMSVIFFLLVFDIATRKPVIFFLPLFQDGKNYTIYLFRLVTEPVKMMLLYDRVLIVSDLRFLSIVDN